MEHSFNVEIAKDLGIAPAVILNHLQFWIKHNEANNSHFHDGYYWTYNSRKAYVSIFPYFTEKQIEYALRKLIDGGYIITGNYNKSPMDRTLWYAITEKGFTILQNCQMQSSKLGEQYQINNNTDIKSKDKSFEGKAPKKKSYKDILGDPDNSIISEQLSRFIKYLSGKNYTPRISTVDKWAELLREQCKGDPKIAEMIVEQSIKEGWKALYPLKRSGGSVSTNYTGNYKKDPEDVARDGDGNPVIF